MVKFPLLAAALVGAVVGSTAPAHADPQNDDTLEQIGYLNTLNKHDIRYGDFADRDQAVRIGRVVCLRIDKQGFGPMDMAGALHNNHHISMHDAETVVGAAIGSFCPWDKTQIGE